MPWPWPAASPTGRGRTTTTSSASTRTATWSAWWRRPAPCGGPATHWKFAKGISDGLGLRSLFSAGAPAHRRKGGAADAPLCHGRTAGALHDRRRRGGFSRDAAQAVAASRGDLSLHGAPGRRRGPGRLADALLLRVGSEGAGRRA